MQFDTSLSNPTTVIQAPISSFSAGTYIFELTVATSNSLRKQQTCTVQYELKSGTAAASELFGNVLLSDVLMESGDRRYNAKQLQTGVTDQNQQYSLTIGSSTKLQLQCAVHNASEPSITWHVIDGQVPQSASISTITHVAHADAASSGMQTAGWKQTMSIKAGNLPVGWYSFRCTGSTGSSESSATYNVRIVGVPTGPACSVRCAVNGGAASCCWLSLRCLLLLALSLFSSTVLIIFVRRRMLCQNCQSNTNCLHLCRPRK